MKQNIIIALLLLCVTLAKAQELKEKSYIITNDNDSIYGQIKITNRKGNLKVIKFRELGTEKYIGYRADKLKGFVKGTRNFESKKIDGTPYFLCLVLDGYVKLYSLQSISPNMGYGNNIDAVTSSANSSTIVQNIFYLERDEKLTRISKLGFTQGMANYVSDCSELSEKIENKTYKFRDIEEIVLMYNEWLLSKEK